MPTTETPEPFSDEELLALLRDESVSPEAISQEMEDAGVAPPHPPAELAQARQLLKQLTAESAAQVEQLAPALRSLVVAQAIQQKAGELLAQLANSRDKHLQKEAKRGLHVLKTQGMKIEAPRPAPSAPAGSAPATTGEELRAYMSSVDGFGERVVFYTCPTRAGVEVAQVVVSDEVGIVNATIAPLGRKEFRKFVQGLGQTARVLVAEVPRSYARSLIAQALDLNARARQPVPAAFNDVAFALGPAVPPQRSPGRALPLPEEQDQLALRGAELMQLSEFRTWLPDEQALKQLALRLDEIAVSPLYIDEAQRDASAKEALHHAVLEYWTPSRRAQIAERLFDVAYLLHAAGRTHDAQLALASAHALDSERPLEAVSFAYALFERVLAIRQGRAGEQPLERTSSSGLILPG